MADAQAEQRHGPLTAEQRRQVGAVVEAYGAFWDNIKFRQGWEKVPIACFTNVRKWFEASDDLPAPHRPLKGINFFS